MRIEGRLLTRKQTDVKYQDELQIDCDGVRTTLFVDRRIMADQFSFMKLSRLTYFDKINVWFFYESHMIKCGENVYSAINNQFDKWGLELK